MTFGRLWTHVLPPNDSVVWHGSPDHERYVSPSRDTIRTQQQAGWSRPERCAANGRSPQRLAAAIAARWHALPPGQHSQRSSPEQESPAAADERRHVSNGAYSAAGRHREGTDRPIPTSPASAPARPRHQLLQHRLGRHERRRWRRQESGRCPFYHRVECRHRIGHRAGPRCSADRRTSPRTAPPGARPARRAAPAVPPPAAARTPRRSPPPLQAAPPRRPPAPRSAPAAPPPSPPSRPPARRSPPPSGAARSSRRSPTRHPPRSPPTAPNGFTRWRPACTSAIGRNRPSPAPTVTPTVPSGPPPSPRTNTREAAPNQARPPSPRAPRSPLAPRPPPPPTPRRNGGTP